MNGCAAAFLYFVIILPAGIALDFAFGTDGMLTTISLIFGFCWLVARSNKAQQDDSASAPDQPRSYYGYGNDDDAQHRARTPDQTHSYWSSRSSPTSPSWATPAQASPPSSRR